MEARHVSKPRMALNALIVVGFCFLVVSSGNLWSDSVAGRLDEDCDPFIGFKLASWVAPSHFWGKQVEFYGKQLSAPFEPPSVQAQRMQALIAQVGAKERAMFEQIRAEQPPPDPVLAQANALRAAADRIESVRNGQLADQTAYLQYVTDRVQAQKCLSKAQGLLSR